MSYQKNNPSVTPAWVADNVIDSKSEGKDGSANIMRENYLDRAAIAIMANGNCTPAQAYNSAGSLWEEKQRRMK